MPRRIPLEHEKAIIEAYKNGSSTNQAAAIYGYAGRTCLAVLRRNKISTRSIAESKRLPIQHEEGMIQAYIAGSSSKEAAAQFGYHSSTCLEVLHRHGISSRSIAESKRLPESHQKGMIEAYLAGATAKQAGAQFGYSRSTCLNVLRRNGTLVRTRSEVARIHSLDESFFDSIDNEIKAYWLGFLSADGAVTLRELRIHLQVGDVEHLHKFRNALRAEHTVTLRQNERQGKKYTYARLSITSRHLVEALECLGVTERKSFTIQPCQYVPENLLPAYWRGVFDGDGSIGIYGKLRPTWTTFLCGNYAMVSGFRNFVSQFVTSEATVRPNGKIFVVTYRGRELPRNIAHLLYDNATIYLDRKYALAQKLLAESE
jgi:hypothetical protein